MYSLVNWAYLLLRGGTKQALVIFYSIALLLSKLELDGRNHWALRNVLSHDVSNVLILHLTPFNPTLDRLMLVVLPKLVAGVFIAKFETVYEVFLQRKWRSDAWLMIYVQVFACLLKTKVKFGLVTRLFLCLVLWQLWRLLAAVLTRHWLNLTNHLVVNLQSGSLPILPRPENHGLRRAHLFFRTLYLQISTTSPSM